MAQIQDFQGMQYSRNTVGPGKKFYDFFNEQYATSSYQIDHDMFPDMIVQPTRDEDVIKAVQWARDHKAAVAIKSGGHQYSGASSTSSPNIQIDLTDTYKERMIFNVGDQIPKDRALVYVGVSLQLQEFNDYLKRHKLFVPHGQCAYVCVGGHGQTGGYGQLGRSFGLFGDNIRIIHMIDYNGVKQEVRKETKPDLFYAILGGSPGNFGVITHYTIEAYQAESYMLTVPGQVTVGKEVKKVTGPYGIKGFWVYTKETLTTLLQLVAQMGDDKTVPRGFDLCVSVLSSDFPITRLFPALTTGGAIDDVLKIIKLFFPEKYRIIFNNELPPLIVVYAQWCPTSKDDKFDDSVMKRFQPILDLNSHKDDLFIYMEQFTDLDMAELTGKWIFPKKREFDLPYVKRTYATSSRTLGKDGWAKQVAGRLDLILNPEQKLGNDKTSKEYRVFDHCKLSVQIQCFGGDNSLFYLNRDNGTSYSWRDSTVVQTVDCFHDMDKDPKKPTYKEYAEKWQAENDSTFKTCFSKQDKRVLWGSYGDWDLGKEEVWKYYYENAEKYERLGKARGLADPNGTFTANPFAVKSIPAKKS